MKIQLRLICKVMCSNGSMKLEIFDQQTHIYTGENLEPGPLEIDCIVEWPTVLTFFLSNKKDNDTQADHSDNIIVDKAIEVVQVFINNFPIHQDLIDKIFICKRNGSTEITHENWWGFNGTVTLNLDQKNPMRYMLSMQNKFDMNRLNWNQT